MLRFVAAAVAGYAAAYVLLEHELPASIPAPVRERLLDARTVLVRARERAREALQAGSRASEEARRDLLLEYRRRSGRLR